MDTTAAIDTINNLVYRPGWTFEAKSPNEWERLTLAIENGRDVPDSLILMRFTTETVDTDRQYAREGYTHPKTLSDVVPIDAGSFESRDQLLFAIFEQLMLFELHESREFFRLKDEDYAAPFHPHREDGNDLYAKCIAETN